MKKLKLVLILITITAALSTLTLKITQEDVKSFALSDTITKINKCASVAENFVKCAKPYQEILVKNVKASNIESIWVENTTKNNWPFCHEQLHQIGHLLPNLTPSQLRSATSGACAYGLLMGYAEHKVQLVDENDLYIFNNEYCDPVLDKGLEYSRQCAHITGHLAFILAKEDTSKALQLCTKTKNNNDNCPSGVYMLHFEKIDQETTESLNPKTALARCSEFEIAIDKCIPLASKIVSIKSVNDLSNLISHCLTLLGNNSTAACDDLLSLNFGKLNGKDMIKARNICTTYPDKEKCTRTLLYVASLATNSIEYINKICDKNIENTLACQNREKEFNKVFGN